MAAERPAGGSFVDTQGSQEGGDDLVVRLRGLPYSATRLDIKELLKDCNIVNGEKGVTFTFLEDGRPSGEAFVDLGSEDDVAKALEHNNEHMGRRYVEIFRASRGEKEWDLRVSCESKEGPGGSRDGGGGGENVVRLRGLPFGASDDQVHDFFSGLSIMPGGIVIQRDEDGKESGIGFVEFTNKDQAERALERDRKSMGHRYIEVFRSTAAEIKPIKSNRPTPYDRPGSTRHHGGYGGYEEYGRSERGFSGGRRGGRGGSWGGGYNRHNQYDNYKEEPYYEDSAGYGGYSGNNQSSFDPGYQQAAPSRGAVSYPPVRPSHQPPRPNQQFPPSEPGSFLVRMRGLPYSAKESDINRFFAPQVPVKIDLELDGYDRPSGDGMVTFATLQDAELAMGKNKNNIGHRYIELFPVFNGEPTPGPPQQQQRWGDPRSQQGPPPPADTGPSGYQNQYYQPPPQQAQGGYGSGGGGGGGGSYQPQSVGYQQPPPTTWAGVGY
ncbi:heterogeneous nuclear ribonucleoprotein F-like isoform X2 [Halichondria panicea]|uniref:heterogeneous nuclear ribonucleoprotein F-like isoform X1 n=1 Tax=Halichondria panicea TaxID=6063 RepID=UPI00312B87E6